MKLVDLFGDASRRRPRVKGLPVEADEGEDVRAVRLALQYTSDDEADAYLERLEIVSRILKNLGALRDGEVC